MFVDVQQNRLNEAEKQQKFSGNIQNPTQFRSEIKVKTDSRRKS